jgi:uncharacterized protein
MRAEKWTLKQVQGDAAWGTMTATIAPSPRIASLDIIRGVAVMGIFSVNIIAFAMIEQAYLNPVADGGYQGFDLAVWLANNVLIDGKMRSLFSMLFGASMLLVIERAEAAGLDEVQVHYRRMAVLLLFGLAHFYLIWFGDILALYALVGMIAFFWRDRSVRALAGWSAGLFAFSALFFASFIGKLVSLDAAAHLPSASPESISSWNDMVAWGAVPPGRAALLEAVHRGGFDTRLSFMLRERLAEPFTQLTFIGWETLALMLLGMAAYKSGFLIGAWDDRRYRKVAIYGLGIGGAISLVLSLLVWRSGFYLPWVFVNFAVVAPFTHVPMALGYAALIILLSRDMGRLAQRLAAVGRCAFSNYLGTSLLAAPIFYGWSLGQFGHWSRAEAWLLVPLFWLMMLAWSKPWLDHYRYGPFEWLWRSLSRGALQPMKKERPEPLPA